MTIRTRILIIVALVALSVFYLVPRQITIRERDPVTGVMTDRTERKVPLKLVSSTTFSTGVLYLIYTPAGA